MGKQLKILGLISIFLISLIAVFAVPSITITYPSNGATIISSKNLLRKSRSFKINSFLGLTAIETPVAFIRSEKTEKLPLLIFPLSSFSGKKTDRLTELDCPTDKLDGNPVNVVLNLLARV